VEGSTLFLLELKRSALMDWRDIWPLFLDSMLQMIPGLAMSVASLNQELYQPPLPLRVALTCPEIIRERCLDKAILGDVLIIITFFLVMVTGLTPTIFAVRTFGRFKSVFFREKHSGLNVFTYFLGAITWDIVHVARNSFIFVSCYLFFGAPSGTFGEWFVIMFLLTYASYGLAYVVSSLVPFTRATIISVVIAICFAVTSGLTPNLEVVNKWGPMPFFWYISFNRWASEAIVIIGVRELDIDRIPHTLSTTGYNYYNFGLDLWILFLIGIVYRVITVAILYRVKSKR